MSRKEQAQKIAKAVRKEYQAFKRTTLKKSKASLWEESGRIHFYRMIMEYFQYAGSEDHDCLEILDGITLPIQAMWNCYLKYEGLEYSTTQGIERILGQMEAELQNDI